MTRRRDFTTALSPLIEQSILIPDITVNSVIQIVITYHLAIY